MNVLLHYNAGPVIEQWLRAQCGREFELMVCPEADTAKFLMLLPEIDVIWHVLKEITADHIAAAPRLRLIHKLGVGLNTIALDAARARSIAVCNTPGANSRAVAEMTLLLMLAVLRKLPALIERCRNPDTWAVPDRLQQGLTELGGRTVGLVGFGAVPSILAPWLTAMGAEVNYFVRAPKPDVPYQFMPLDELIATSDILSLHVPLTAETTHLISAERLKRMKFGSVLINTARGGLVDEAALIEALQQGPLVAAGLDVFAKEPTPADNRLLELENVVATPHVAWLTRETLVRCLTTALANTKRLQRGEPLQFRAL
jgi:phosphoglycerate dehydrogenase-like enzyme